MGLGVFLRDTEVDVEQAEVAGRGGFGRLASQHRLEPVDVDELLVLRQSLDRQRGIGGPGREPRLVHASTLDAEAHQALGQAGCVRSSIAVHHDRSIGGDPLPGEQSGDLGLIDRIEPGDGKCHGAGDVAAAVLGAEPPSVVRREWAHVDDGERRIIECDP